MDATVLINHYKKEFITAVMLILLGACGNAVISQEKPYNPYEIRVNEVDYVIQEFINNPTSENNEAAYDALFMQTRWAERQYGEQNDIYKAYLNECDNVRLAVLNGEDVETSQMESLKNELI